MTKALLKPPGLPASLVEVGDTPHSLREILGGPIKSIRIATDACIVVRADCEALPDNICFCNRHLRGPVLFIATKGRKFVDLPQETADFLKSCFEIKKE